MFAQKFGAVLTIHKLRHHHRASDTILIRIRHNPKWIHVNAAYIGAHGPT
jgi:hypothetical protein